MTPINDPPFVCECCGTCCRNGPPGLHDTDAPRVMERVIEPEALFTIRAGELVRDNVKGGLVYIDTEIIKIRTAPGSAACRFFREGDNACGIYENRPAQCRAMKCRDTAAIVDMHGKNRLNRGNLFGAVDWLWDIIETHESRCGFGEIRSRVEQRRAGRHEASRQLEEMVSYDRALRDVVVEKGILKEGMLPLVFGLPVDVVLERRFGIRTKNSHQ